MLVPLPSSSSSSSRPLPCLHPPDAAAPLSRLRVQNVYAQSVCLGKSLSKASASAKDELQAKEVAVVKATEEYMLTSGQSAAKEKKLTAALRAYFGKDHQNSSFDQVRPPLLSSLPAIADHACAPTARRVLAAPRGIQQ